ncbi:hypothetical protein SLEP1_g27101 [Rubroshorea leprosula]|uniref:Uncharacterized protein n=1 Tax=Rubroshorea leprosula TaxID=152421 RepID=A0AAV5JUV2_9ROSI|nr:hypothetical protein SLEP1_g27101 [Rubroshorea leprosula]
MLSRLRRRLHSSPSSPSLLIFGFFLHLTEAAKQNTSVGGSTAHRLAHHHSPSAPCSTGQKQQSKTPPSAALQLTIQPIIAHLQLHPPLDRSSNTMQNRINRSASLLRLSPPSPSSTKQKQQRKTKITEQIVPQKHQQNNCLISSVASLLLLRLSNKSNSRN